MSIVGTIKRPQIKCPLSTEATVSSYRLFPIRRTDLKTKGYSPLSPIRRTHNMKSATRKRKKIRRFHVAKNLQFVFALGLYVFCNNSLEMLGRVFFCLRVRIQDTSLWRKTLEQKYDGIFELLPSFYGYST